MASVTGIISAKVDGAKLQIKEQTGELDTGGAEREGHMSGNKLVGCSKKFVPAKFTATLVHTSAADTDEINGWEGVKLLVETDSGVQWMITNAHTAKPAVVKGGGECALEMLGNPAEQIAP